MPVNSQIQCESIGPSSRICMIWYWFRRDPKILKFDCIILQFLLFYPPGITLFLRLLYRILTWSWFFFITLYLYIITLLIPRLLDLYNRIENKRHNIFSQRKKIFFYLFISVGADILDCKMTWKKNSEIIHCHHFRWVLFGYQEKYLLNKYYIKYKKKLLSV